MEIGSWTINIQIGKAPQKIASAVSELGERLIGAEYNFIAYLGSQIVNGVNHAVLAEQILTTGKDTKNVVILIFNEKDGKVTLVAIDRVITQGETFGGISVNIQTEIPGEALATFNKAFEGFVGSNIKPFALLGTQITNGVNYIFITSVEPVVENPEEKVAIVVVNRTSKEVRIMNLLSSKDNVISLGYAFSW